MRVMQHYYPQSSDTDAYSGTAGHSEVAPAGIHKVRIVTTTDAFVVIGKGAVATTSGMFMPANTPEVFSIAVGERVSAIQSASNGNLHVTWLTQG